MKIAILLTVGAASFAQPYRPAIPKTWDGEALRTMEAPLATPSASPVHIGAERYYAIPAMIVYKTYPMRMPGKNGEEYMDWLRQEPELIRFSSDTLRSKEDWVRAGKYAFEWPTRITAENSG